MLAGLGVLMISTAWWVYRGLLPADPGRAGSERTAKILCQACGFTGEVRVGLMQTFPVACPKCRERACTELWRCRRCQKEFVPQKTGQPIRCPNPDCQSENVGAAVEPNP